MAIPLIAGLISTVGPAIVKGAKKLFQKKAAQAVGGKIADSVGGALGNKLSSALNPKEAALARGDILSNAQQQIMDFNASEAQKNRDFQQSMFDQQTQLANTEMQRKVADYQAAGLNPAALMGSGSVAGASLPTAGSGSAASAPSGGAAGNLSDLFQMQKIEAEISYMKAQEEAVKAAAAKTKSETTGQDIQNQYAESYWKNQIDIMESSRTKIVADAALTEQKLKTEEFQTAIQANNLDVTWLESQVKMYELFMTKLDYKAKDEILGLQMDCMRAAAAKDEATVDVLTEQIGEIVARTGLAMEQSGYFKHLGREQKAVADFWSSDKGKASIEKSAEGSAEKTYREGKFAKYGVWLNGIGNFLKDVGIGVGAAMSVKNLKGALAAQQVVPSNVEPNYNIPGL